MKDTQVLSTSECYECPDARQVRRLFMAVLLRAVRDLQSGPQHQRRHTREWFISTARTMPDGISYQDILCELDLEAALVTKIDRLVYDELSTEQVAGVPSSHPWLHYH